MILVDRVRLLCIAKYVFILILMDLKHSKFGSRPICFSKPYHVSHHKFIRKIPYFSIDNAHLMYNAHPKAHDAN